MHIKQDQVKLSHEHNLLSISILEHGARIPWQRLMIETNNYSAGLVLQVITKEEEEEMKKERRKEMRGREEGKGNGGGEEMLALFHCSLEWEE